MKGQYTEARSHVFGPKTGGCWCGTYHYTCARCGADCTQGTSAGPATTATDGVTRCHECNRAWDDLRAALSPWTMAEVDAVRACLSQFATDGDPIPVTDEQRKIVTSMLSRSERR